MRVANVLKTTVFRVSALYVVAFTACLAVLGAATYSFTAASLHRRLDHRIRQQMNSFVTDYHTGGLPSLKKAVSVAETFHPNGALDYAVVSHGQRVAGHLTKWPSQPGWATLAYPEADGDTGQRRFLVTDLVGGGLLAVAADPEQIVEIEQAILDGFLSAFGAVLLLGAIGGIGLSVSLLKRVDNIRQTAQAIIAGDISRRIPLHGANDDFDRLAETLNRMLDRIADLMESLKDVSANIAHDLKTPLARLRQQLEAAEAKSDGERNASLRASIDLVDEILATFSALLRIAQIESGTRRAGFTLLDLSELFSTIAETFAPAAEDAGQSLSAEIQPDLWTAGDRELLTQMLANIVENAIRHTPPGTRILIGLHQEKGKLLGTVSDNGAGVPGPDRDHIFKRFHRLSDTIPGSGLGLSLVKAVADIHGIPITLEDANPGLKVAMEFESSDVPGITIQAKIPDPRRRTNTSGINL
jgi:signal transduction histidine kinase